MRNKGRTICLTFLLVTFLTAPLVSLLARQNFTKIDREDDRAMLRDALDAIKKHYYDPKFHGLDLDKLYAQYDQKMQAAQSNHEAFRIIAGFLENLDDSHTFFEPPSHVNSVDYGYIMQMIGDNCFVTRLRPGTDAETKLHPGDQILKREGYAVTRKDIWTMQYYFQDLDLVGQSVLDLQDPSGQQRHIEVKASVREGSKIANNDFWHLSVVDEDQIHAMRDRIVEKGDVTIWKMSWFFDDDLTIEQHFDVVRKHPSLILDLRGNPGGNEEVLAKMLGYLFDHDVKIADRVTRKDTKPLIAKTRGGGGVFSGKLIVLVDSDSASAAELFARVIQLEKRGVVLGDRSSGKVMEARVWQYQQGGDTVKFYNFEVTEADLIMKDGNSLEKNGVIPAETLLPTAADLAAGRDPVLSGAAALLGVTLDPVEAGKMFPYEWVPL
jgi:C-terminal processing protease CtpA/Prc